MGSFTSSHHDQYLKRRWVVVDEKAASSNATATAISSSTSSMCPRFNGAPASGGGVTPSASLPPEKRLLGFSALDHEEIVASTVIPPVTVVLEGRSICHRVHLHKHASYESLAAALRGMFVDADSTTDSSARETEAGRLDLANAVPGHMVAYEDMEDDLLLAGDLNWKDFVRVAKRIRILPAKPNRRKKKNTIAGRNVGF